MDNYNASELHLIELLAGHGITLRRNEVKDFGLDGSETLEQVEMYGRDYLSECETDKAEYAAFKRNPSSVDPINY